MSHFEEFERTYGPPSNCEMPSEEVIQTYEGELPAQLLDHWRQVGWCAYGEGLLWFTDPQQFEGVIDDWVNVESGRALVFMRTAFAHLYLWYEGYAYSLHVQTGGLSQVTENIEEMFSLLCWEKLQEKILRLELYREVMKQLGPPNRDECYAFVPALPVGGPGTADTVQRVKLREHLGFLGQLVLT